MDRWSCSDGPMEWTDLYKHVIGVVHTNYQVYLEELGYAGIMSSPTIRQSLFSTFTSMVCSAYCDVTIKLSSAGISLPNEVQYNVHGVRQEFFDMAKRSSVGKKRWLPFQETNESTGSLVYFIGKAVKPKGWVQLLNLLETLPDTEVRSGRFRVDAFGSGPEEEEIAEMVQQLNQKREGILQMFPGRNHADKHFEQYKVLVNASTTEMLCTVTAEALAMGKHVVLAEDPSNAYFKANFPERCHFFNLQDPSSFHRALQDALEKEGPLPLSSAAEALLSWDAALERFYDASQVHVLSGRLERPSEARGAKIAFEIHSRFQTDTPAFSKLLKSATLNQEMEFKAPWAELGTTSELMDAELQRKHGWWSCEGHGRRPLHGRLRQLGTQGDDPGEEDCKGKQLQPKGLGVLEQLFDADACGLYKRCAEASFGERKKAILQTRLDGLLQDLFSAHDLNKNGLLEELELIQLNKKIVLLHQGRNADMDAVKEKYQDLFRRKLDAAGKAVPFSVFKAYMLQVLADVDPDPCAQEMMLEQWIVEAQAARVMFHMPSVTSVTDLPFLSTISFDKDDLPASPSPSNVRVRKQKNGESMGMGAALRN
ncbi:unnamed protein product [Durusdinium trenchii]|uniref:digalactosyldiacylglycerol synthase n=1 Tax=Durusdinium trenchii TaxID=1381693 RepID=A0ABP0K9R5_9DINO